MTSPAVIGVASAVGSAVLALWLLGRHRDLGPQTLKGAFAGVVLATALLTVIGPAMTFAVAVAGRPIALLAVGDPILAFAFWSGGVLIRAFLTGPGVPTRAHERARRPKNKRD